MERSIFLRIKRVLRALGRRRVNARFGYTDGAILEVYLWGVIHGRTSKWACDPQNWPKGPRRGPMPDASTLSRRMRSPPIARLIERLRERLESADDELVAVVDGKPLPIGPHSHDRLATALPPAARPRLHAIVARRGRVLSWRVAPMNVDERNMARRMLRELEHAGCLLADANDDSNRLFELAGERGVQIVAPRRYGPGRNVGRRSQSPARLRSKDMLEQDDTGFGRRPARHRWSIERFFGTLSNAPVGLDHLPTWVRGWRRVHNWVAAKLLINAARAALRREVDAIASRASGSPALGDPSSWSARSLPVRTNFLRNREILGSRDRFLAPLALARSCRDQVPSP